MNFFEHQELARRNTRVLVVLYGLAVVAVVAAVTAVFAGAYLYKLAADVPGPVSLADVPPALYWGAALGTLALILAVTVVQSLRLGGGGEVVARMAGARPVSPETRDPLERRLLNVVEEMAIAAGVRVPKVYVMAGEPGINAFAAGSEVSNAVVAVTRGTLETLNRDELQGVIGHEFSHILHGDMRINIRMIGILAGIVFIGSIGRFAMQAMGRGGGGRKNGAAAVFAVGVALFIIGYTGLFFARLIKAAIARQREFLADASSVQYTRNPDGIAGALDQIRASTRGTLIEGRSAEELSHMYFGESVNLWLSGIFATHPPVDERIRRVHPGFEPSKYRARRPAAQLDDADDARRRQAAEGLLATAVLAAGGKRTADAAHAWGRTPQASAQLVGTLDAEKVDRAQRLVDALPAELRESVRAPEGARTAVLALVGPQAAAGRLDTALHLPLVDLALPALKNMDEAGRTKFLDDVETAIRADRRVSLHEFVLQTLLRHQLAPQAPVASGKRIEDLREESLTLLSLIAFASHADTAAAFEAGVAQLGGLHEARLLGQEAITPQAAGAALDRLRGLAPLAKALLVKALFAAATADGTIRLGEAELLRVTGAVLDCPLPPLVT
ncbi:MAG: M48 family metallopeptidase [Burkholderiales bacterium]